MGRRFFSPESRARISAILAFPLKGLEWICFCNLIVLFGRFFEFGFHLLIQTRENLFSGGEEIGGIYLDLNILNIKQIYK